MNFILGLVLGFLAIRGLKAHQSVRIFRVASKVALVCAGALLCWALFAVCDVLGVEFREAYGEASLVSQKEFPTGKVRTVSGESSTSIGLAVVKVPEGEVRCNPSHVGAGRLRVRYRVGRMSGRIHVEEVISATRAVR